MRTKWWNLIGNSTPLSHGSALQIRSGCIEYLRLNLMPWITISLWSALNPLAMTGEARDILSRKGGNSFTFLKSWQSSPSRPYERSVMTMKTFKFWKGVTWSKLSPLFYLPNYRLSAYTSQQILTVCMMRIKRLNNVRKIIFNNSEDSTRNYIVWQDADFVNVKLCCVSK